VAHDVASCGLPMTEPLRATGRRILIVDDDQGTRSGLKRFFERENYEVLAVSTFADGRQALAKAAPDLLIADVRLGDYNGLQLLATNPRSIPTIIVTGFADPVLEADARRLGADYLLKPISPGELLAMVKQRLETATEAGLPFRPGRRWLRKPVSGELSARIEDTAARIVEISYGGVRFQIERSPSRTLPSSLAVVLPHLSVVVDLVWTVRSDDDSWTCGASIAPGQRETVLAWHRMVDAHSAFTAGPA
jgi:DNA-binding response OmpR family regulator